MKNDELLLTKLLEETCAEEVEQSFKEAIVGDLSTYFEKRVNQVEFISFKKYLEQQSLSSFELLFNEKSNCYRVTIGSLVLDFPSNWSIFSKLSSEELTYIRKEEDEDFLCDLLSEVVGSCESFLLVNDYGNYNLITFQEEKAQQHIEWMVGYFDKKNEAQKAA